MNPSAQTCTTTFSVADYALAATLNSGQAFRWEADGDGWVGVVDSRWVRLAAVPGGIGAETPAPVAEWEWLATYLQVGLDLRAVIRTFPDDAPMRSAANSCRGLRLLRQDPWECLASFILSSTKQILQIRQIVSLVCQRFGEPLQTPPGRDPAWSFPTPATISSLEESDLRACKMGFRAPYLLGAARRVTEGWIDLDALSGQPVEEARSCLMDLPGVGPKIADCVLLFAYGFQSAFPVDVWLTKALRQLYFPMRRPSPASLRHFADTHFGPFAGYAQQYLFHYVRTRDRSHSS